MLQHHILGNKNLVNLYAPLESIATILAAIGDTPVATVRYHRLFAPTTKLINTHQILRDYKANAYEQYFPGMNGNGESFSFNSIEEARNAFDYGRYLFTSSDLKHLQCVPATVALTMEGHIANLTAMTSIFSDGLNAFVKKRSTSLTPKEEMAAAVLQLHVLNTYVSLHLEHSPPSCRPQSDQFHSQMIEMVSLGDRIVSAISSSSVLGESATTFCLDMGYIIPLYTVASQCHDPPLRRRAIALLRMASRQEGLWNSLQVARAAERIMEIEEGENVLLQPFTPDAAQSIVLRPSTILQLSSNSLRLQYVLQKDGVTVSHGVVEELFQW